MPRDCIWSLFILAILLLSACYPAHDRAVPQRIPVETTSAQKITMAQLYFYPKSNQSNEQQSRDHYECYTWAVKQTGFDPGQSAIPKDQRMRVVPMPLPGHDTATFAIAGAVLGALIGGPRHAAGGALIGASGGIIAGAASDSARMESTRQQEEAYAVQNQIRENQIEAKTMGFRRAMSACMESCGYSVR